jgi:hypothetical protein
MIDDSRALCQGDEKSSAWFSYQIEDINYAKSVCAECEVKLPCFFNALENEFMGVNAGISEFEFMMKTWKEAKTKNESNWTRSDKVLQRILREAL